MAIRKKRVTRRSQKSSGHPFMVLLFFVCLIMGSAYMTDRMTNAPDAQPAEQVTAIRHLFNDKEMQGLVPKDDPGTPESVKEKIKAAINKAVTVEVKADDETPVKSKEEAPVKVAAKSETTNETEKEETPISKPSQTEEKKDTFSVASVMEKITGKKETKPEVETKEVKLASAAQSSSVSSNTTPVEKKAETKAVETKKTETPAVSKKTNTTEKAAVSSSEGKKSVQSTTNESTKKGTEKAVPAKAAPISPVKEMASGKVTGKLAVVIDDAGRDLASQAIYEKMGIPLTLAVMPNQVHTREAAASWAAHGLPVIIHQPMESVSGIGMEPQVILTSMSDEAMRQMLKSSFSQVPEAVGMNNHQGSKATTDRHTMDVVMNELHHRNMFFFDSHTNSTTEADKAAAAYGVRYAKNDLFVDNSANEADICQMIQEGANRAKKNGVYIIIGHCRPHTAAAFQTMVPKLKAQGIEFVYVSSLLR